MWSRPAVSTMRIVRSASLRGLDGVERHRGRVGARALAHDRHAGPLAPALELLDRRGAEGVAGGEQDLAPLLAQAPGELPAGRRLAGAVHADHEHHGRPRVESERRPRSRPAPRAGGPPERGARPIRQPPAPRLRRGPRSTNPSAVSSPRSAWRRISSRSSTVAGPELLSLKDAREALLERGPRLAEPIAEALAETREELHGSDLGRHHHVPDDLAALAQRGQRLAVQLELDAARVAQRHVKAPRAVPLAHRARRERVLGRLAAVWLDAHPRRLDRAHHQHSLNRARRALGRRGGGGDRWHRGGR